MDELKISLSHEAEQNTDEAIQCLIEAASQIFISSEQNFQSMKNTKWYQRLWKLVTFSRDNEKKLASGVSNLSKLQEIVMKALLLLAEKSAKISDFVCQHNEQLARISQNQAAMARTQNAILDELDRLKSGAEKTITLYDIVGEKQKIFMIAFCSVVDSMDRNTSLSQEYYRQVSHALNFSDAQPGIMLKSVEILNRHEALLLYRIIMEYVFLGTDSFDCEAEVLKYLAVSPKDSATTKDFIAKQVIRGGREILLNNKNINEYAFVEDDDIDWDFDNAVPNEDGLDEEFTEEYSDITLNEIMHIEAGDNYVYKKKRINLMAFIECEGTLCFDDCLIIIDDSEAPKSSIELTENGAIIFKDCRLFMMYKESDFLISAAKNTSIRLQNCFLNGFGMFIETAGNCEVDSCQFVNPGVNLISCKSWDGSYCSVRNSVFYQRYYPSHIEYTGGEAHSSIIQGINLIDNCKVERQSDCFSHSSYGKEMAFLDSNNVTISHMTFKNWTNCIRAYGDNEIIVKVSAFEQCLCAISAHKLNVENCNFYRCLNPIKTSGNSVVSHCQFYKCYGNFIASTSQINIKYCLFDTYELSRCFGTYVVCNTNASVCIKGTTVEIETVDFYANSIIHISHEKDEKGFSQIEKCRFYNIDSGNSYLIKGNDFVNHENTLLKISDCEFSSCKTLRKDKKIVRRTSLRECITATSLTMGLIIPLRSLKTIKEYTNVYLYNCSGISHETGAIAYESRGIINKFVPREFTASKEKIGCSLKEE